HCSLRRAFDDKHSPAQNGLRELTSFGLESLALDVLHIDGLARECATRPAIEHHDLLGFELFDNIWRMRSSNRLTHLAQHEPGDASLCMRGERDLRFFHRENHGMLL